MYVGIDFSKNDLHLAIHQADGQSLESDQRYANSQVGYQQAKALLLQTLQAQAARGVEVAGEATSYYWLPLFVQMDQDAELASYDLQLHLLNARWVRWYKKSVSPHHKDDQVDPEDIAEYVRLHPSSTSWHYDAHWLPLRFYTRLRFHLVKSCTREKNLFNLYLFLAYATYTHHHPFADHLGQTSRALLSDPSTLDSFAQLSLEELTEQLWELSEHHLPDPQQNARRLAQVLAERFPLDPALAQPIQRGLTCLLDTIELLEQQIQQVEAWIAEQVQTGYDPVAWLDSIPGVGPVLASGIAAEIADLERFTTQPIFDKRRKRWRNRRSAEVVDAVCKYAGLWWPKNASGQFEAEERRLSREGNAYLRYYVLEAADRMRQRIPSFASYYQRKYAEANKHKHKRALVLAGCKALTLCVTLLRRKEAFRAKEVDRTLL